MVGFDTTKPSARMKFSKPTLLPSSIGHQTPAVRTLFGLASKAMKRGTGKKKAKGTHMIKAHTTKKGVKVRGHRAKLKAGAVHLKKGSLAAKRHMSALRKKKKAA
jgi:hypothetical protein